MSDVSIKYKGVERASMNSSGSKTIKTAGKYCEGDIVVDYNDPEKPTQTKSVTPTAAGIIVNPDSGKVLSQVTVNGDENLIPGNIKSGENIFGVAGTYAGDFEIATGVVTFTENTAQYDFLGSSRDKYDVFILYQQNTRSDIIEWGDRRYVWGMVQDRRPGYIFPYFTTFYGVVPSTNKIYANNVYNNMANEFGTINLTPKNTYLGPTTYRWFALKGVTVS